LIEATGLAAAPGRSGWLILDCRFDLARPGWGESAYAAGHCPARCTPTSIGTCPSPVTATSGRHPLPDPVQFAALAAPGASTSAIPR
jgi:thiosulfate/3-mercaptopyruvate sulfurtransferase